MALERNRDAIAASEKANALADTARAQIAVVARNVYMSGGHDPRLSATLELLTADDIDAAASSDTVMNRTMAVHAANLDDANRAVAAAAVARGAADEAARAAQQQVDVAGHALFAAQKAAGVAGQPVGQYDAYATLYESLLGAATMRWWDGTSGSVDHMCLKNAESVWTALGGGNENGMYPTAASAGAAYANAGKLSPYIPGQVVPRGMVVFWDSSIGSGAGHVAMSDGKGNTINNWGSGTIVSTPLSSQATGAIIGWGPPTVFGHAPN